MGGALFKLVKKKGSDQMTNVPQTFWELECNDIQGKPVKFEELKGKKLYLMVNVASACGLTDKNYKQLKKFHDEYEAKGLHIIGFPCNQFRDQETQCDADIEETIRTKFKIKFQMMSKIEVNGQNCHPIYKYLRANSPLWDAKTKKAKEIPWNFTKFLVDSSGKVVKYYPPEIPPNDFRAEVEGYLN